MTDTIPEISKVGKWWACTVTTISDDGLCLDVDFARTKWGAQRKLKRIKDEHSTSSPA